ncbi:MAG: toprim domain-containing protein [Chloroflexota bacterium]
MQSDRYTDFASGESGDLFGLLMVLYNLANFKEAVKLALEMVGGSVLPPRQPRPQTVSLERNTPPSPAWQQAAQDAVVAAEKYLWSDRPDAAAVRRYLIHERGLTEATMRRFRLGFTPRWTKTTWRKPDTGNTVEYASLPPGIVIPCFADGSLWYVKVRCIVGALAAALHQKPAQLGNTESPKYLNLVGGTQGALFNADALSEGKPALVVEGEFDAMLADQLCHEQVTAVTVGSAANSLLPHFQQHLEKASLILLCLDNDRAGQDGVSRLQTRLQGQVYPISLPTSKDVGDYVIQKQGDLLSFVTEALATTRPLPQAASLSNTTGLPDTLRAALNRYCYPAIAPTWELWHEAIEAGLLTPIDPVTVKRLWTVGQRLGRDTSIDTLKSGLKAGTGQFWGVLQTGISQKKEVALEILPPICKTPRNTTGSGRKAVEYILCSPQRQRANLLALAAPRILEKHFPASEATIAPVKAEFLVALGCEPAEATRLAQGFSKQCIDLITSQPELQVTLDRARLDYKRLVRDMEKSQSTPLPNGWTYRNAAAYVGVFARALAEANPTMQQSRRQLARTIGRSPRSMDAVLDRAGVTNEPQVTDQPITSVAEFAAIEAAYDSSLKGYPVRVISLRGETMVRERRFGPEQQDFVTYELAAGAQVWVRYQQASHQVIASATQPLPRSRQVRPPENPSRQVKQPVSSRYYGLGFDPRWCEVWAIKLMEQTTTWRKRGAVLANVETGELVEYSPRMMLEILLSPGADIPSAERERLPEVIGTESVRDGRLCVMS